LPHTVLEQQHREAEDAKKRNQQEVLDMERRILERDQDLYNRDRVKQLEEKAKRTTVFVNHNDALVEMKRFQQHKDV
jgi:hypothetical protein